MFEEWKKIDGFENYEVSNLGQVRSLNYHRENRIGILKPKTDKDGYYAVTLRKNGKNYCKRVNQLVGIAFIPNPNNLPIVHHKDENKQHNSVDNLEWSTNQENTLYSSYKWTGENNGMNKPGVREKHKLAVNTKEHKEKLRQFILEHQPMNNPDSVKKISDKRKNGWWVTDGNNNKFIHDELETPCGWHRGLSRHKGVMPNDH